MATKQPTLASLKKDIAAREAENAKLIKDLAQEKSYKEMYSKSADEAKKELESIHSLLDVLPNALARKTMPNSDESWNVVTHTLMTRLAAYLALRG